MGTINKEEILAGLGHVVVLKGGASVERDISLISGGAVFEGLRRLGVNVSAIDVGDDVIAELEAAKPDLAFIMLHGQGGEDGVIQGLLEVMQIPYTGSDVSASALAMDKVKSKLIWQRLGLSTPDFVALNQDTDWQAVIDHLGKVAVKPVNGGSSLGIFIVGDAGDLQAKYQEAAGFDANVIAEKCIEGREFSTGILGDQLLPTVQLQTDREFYDFEAKYKDENTHMLCPPELAEAEQAELDELVRAAYDSLGCSGLSRVDVMQSESGQFFLLELNTVPGMTGHSLVPAAAQSIGIDFDELLLHILAEETGQAH